MPLDERLRRELRAIDDGGETEMSTAPCELCAAACDAVGRGRRGIVVGLVTVLVAGSVALMQRSDQDVADETARVVSTQLVRADVARARPAVADDVVRELVADNRVFAFDLYERLGREEDGNLFFSPHSISTALAMTYPGARGKTAEEMAKTLHFTLAGDELHAAFNRLTLDLSDREGVPAGLGAAGEPLKLEIANALWGQTGYPFREEFLRTLASHYDAAVNLSLGGGRFTDWMGCIALNPSRAAGIASLRSIGVAAVGATGNDGYTTAIAAPACLTNIAVPSTTKSDQVSVFSNRLNTPIGAPGEGIVSSFPGGLYAARSGTSMAAAHIAGTVAILKQAVPSATVQQLFFAISTTGLYIQDPPSGGSVGRVQVAAARNRLLAGVDLPGTPGRPVAVVNGASVTISWTQGPGATPLSYDIEAGTYPGATNIGSFNVGSATSVTAAPGAGVYYIRIRARNNSGLSDPSAETSFSIGGADSPPGTPGALTATVVGRVGHVVVESADVGRPAHALPAAGRIVAGRLLAGVDQRGQRHQLHRDAAGRHLLRARAGGECGRHQHLRQRNRIRPR